MDAAVNVLLETVRYDGDMEKKTEKSVDARLVVVARDAYFLAVDKPAGLLVHSDGTGAPTLTDRVTAYLQMCDEDKSLHDFLREQPDSKTGQPNPQRKRQAGPQAGQPVSSQVRPQAVQRLDKPTTGLVLFSLDKATQPAFDALIAGHEMHKRYLAVVRGAWPAKPQVIDAPIGRDRHDSHRMRVSKTGKPAQTRVELLERKGGYSLLLVELLTGRKHQIRVHLASRGFPIVGDDLYGGRVNKEGLMLHAWQEEFDHPVTGEHILLKTAWPERFTSLGFGPR